MQGHLMMVFLNLRILYKILMPDELYFYFPLKVQDGNRRDGTEYSQI